MRRLPRRAALRLARAVRPHGHVHRVLDARAARPEADMCRVQAADREGAAAGHKPAHPCMCTCVRRRMHVPLCPCTRLPSVRSVSLLRRVWRMACLAWGLLGAPCWSRLGRRPERVASHTPRTFAARAACPIHRCYVRRCRPESCDGWLGLDDGVRRPCGGPRRFTRAGSTLDVDVHLLARSLLGHIAAIL